SAFVLPTPASSNAVVGQVTVVSVTVHEGVGVPVTKCVPVGAFAKLTVRVWEARAGEAKKPTSKSDDTAVIPPMSPLLSIYFPSLVSLDRD
ncbi:MAG TPA: hypothetical protein VIV12_09395, partial [Streptosporangiaceae bacterium]